MLLHAQTNISVGTVNGNVNSLSGDNSTMNITKNEVTEITKDNVENITNNTNKDNVETHINTHIENVENDIETDINTDTINGDLQSTSGNSSDIKNKDNK